MSLKPTLRIFVAVLAIVGLSCTASAQNVIKIAVGAPLTGPLAKQGQEVANAVKLAAEEWNAKGGVLGKQLPSQAFTARACA
jgi:branched-chain amino acid transport system substrate-binding protein